MSRSAVQRQPVPIATALERLDTDLDIQAGRLDLLGIWLDEHDTRLKRIAERIDSTRARLDALLAARARA